MAGGRLQTLLRTALTDPRRVLRTAMASLRARVLLRHCDRGKSVYANGPVRVRSRGTVRVGDRVTFAVGSIPTELVCHEGASVSIGDETVLNYGASIEAHASVRIGRRCMIASFVRIADRDPNGARPVVIGDDVWIAHGATIEAGVEIGDGSVVSAGTVVTRDVPPRSVVAGNPARSMALALAAPDPRAARADPARS